MTDFIKNWGRGISLLLLLGGVGIAQENVAPLVAEARRFYFEAKQANSADALVLFEKGLKAAEAAKQLSPEDSGALVWWAANRGGIADLKRNLASLAAIRDIEKILLIVQQKDPAYGFAAADRALGVLYHQAPGFVSIGSNKKAEKHLNQAMAIAKDYPGNQLALADFLQERGKKEEARKIVRSLIENPAWRKKDFAEFSPEKADWEKRISQWPMEGEVP